MRQSLPRPLVLLITGKDPVESTGGHSVYCRMWARAAVAAGFEPELFCVSHSEGVVETDYGRVHRIPSPFRRLRDVHRTGFRARTIGWHVVILRRAILSFARGLAPGRRVVVHGFQAWTAAGIPAVRRMRSQGQEARFYMTAYTVIAHELHERWRGVWALPGVAPKLAMSGEMLSLHLAITPCERRAAREVDRILVNYESVRRLVTEAWKPTCPIERVPYTTETALIEDREPSPLPDGVPLVLAVSRHDSRKGLDTLLKAFALLKRAGVLFRARLVGGGSLLPIHRRLASDLGLDDAVEITGYVEDTRPHWDAASVFVLPSHEEGSGSLSLLEAMQQGKAIVASGVDGIPEDIEDGCSGLLVPAKNPEALAAALRRVLGDRSLRETLARSARARFEERFAPPLLVKAVAELYGAPPTSLGAAGLSAAGRE